MRRTAWEPKSAALLSSGKTMSGRGCGISGCFLEDLSDILISFVKKRAAVGTAARWLAASLAALALIILVLSLVVLLVLGVLLILILTILLILILILALVLILVLHIEAHLTSANSMSPEEINMRETSAFLKKRYHSFL